MSSSIPKFMNSLHSRGIQFLRIVIITSCYRQHFSGTARWASYINIGCEYALNYFPNVSPTCLKSI